MSPISPEEMSQRLGRALSDSVSDAIVKLGRLRTNPRLLGREINRLYYRSAGPSSSEKRIDVFEADWDDLVVLDACRYDLFEAVADLPGELERRRSAASNTVEFLQANIAGRDLRDTVYVTANPQFQKHQAALDAEFHAIIDLWDDGWDAAMNTVLPETVTKATLDAADEYPNKRLLVHYNQPHVPFIGPIGRDAFDLESMVDHPLPFWQQPMAGVLDVSDDVLREAYQENLDLTVPHVDRLLDELRGKTIVTSDHGNMIGERAFSVPIREYGHPEGIHTSELTTVPWLVHVSGDRKHITVGSLSNRDTDTTDKSVSDRLKYLGYSE